MEVWICDNSEHVGLLAAQKVAQSCANKKSPVIGLATGSSPLALYSALANQVAEGSLDLSQAYGFALDEYVGIDPKHSQSYAETIRKYVTEPLKMNPDKVHVPNGAAADLKEACKDYEKAIKQAGGVDVQILGVGANGHIGFNEPTSSFGSRTRVKTLTVQTRQDNARFFTDGETVPTHCLTQGLGTIMEARHLVLVANGDHKAKAVAQLIEGPVTAVCPASILQFHPKVAIIIDNAAATELKYLDYYKHIMENMI